MRNKRRFFCWGLCRAFSPEQAGELSGGWRTNEVWTEDRRLYTVCFPCRSGSGTEWCVFASRGRFARAANLVFGDFLMLGDVVADSYAAESDSFWCRGYATFLFFFFRGRAAEVRGGRKSLRAAIQAAHSGISTTLNEKEKNEDLLGTRHRPGRRGRTSKFSSAGRLPGLEFGVRRYYRRTESKENFPWKEGGCPGRRSPSSRNASWGAIGSWTSFGKSFVIMPELADCILKPLDRRIRLHRVKNASGFL